MKISDAPRPAVYYENEPIHTPRRLGLCSVQNLHTPRRLCMVVVGTESLLAAAETPGKKEIIILIKFNSRVLAYARHCHCCNQQHCCEQLQRECSEGECHSWP